jgi:Cu/Ag efflux pump CusA
MSEYLTGFSMSDFIEDDINPFAVNSVENEQLPALISADIIAQAMETAGISENETLHTNQNMNAEIKPVERLSTNLQNEKNKGQAREVRSEI